VKLTRFCGQKVYRQSVVFVFSHPSLLLRKWQSHRTLSRKAGNSTRDASLVFHTRTEVLEGERVDDWVDNLRFTV
jgi:hypothetical protein